MDVQSIGFDLMKALVGFSIGFSAGWITRGLRDKSQTNIDNEKVIALLVAFIWAISVIADIINPSYDTPIALHGLMGGIVGFYYKKKFKNEN